MMITGGRNESSVVISQPTVDQIQFWAGQVRCSNNFDLVEIVQMNRWRSVALGADSSTIIVLLH